MIEVELFDVGDLARLRAAVAVRLRVFVEEQGFAAETECDEHDSVDASAVHVLAREDAVTLGTGRLVLEEPGTARLGRMAVLPEARGRGVGSQLLDTLLGEAARRKFGRVVLLAQLPACEFYRRASFRAAGNPQWEEGVLHQPMLKPIRAEEGG